MNYSSYLQTKEWAILAMARRKIDGNKCYCCGTTEALNVHHLFYPPDLNDTTQQMLVTLCHDCHVLVHRILEVYDNEYNRAGIILTKNGYVSYECRGYQQLMDRAHRWLIVELWKKGLFSLQDVKTYIGKVNEVLDNSNRGKFYLSAKVSMDMLAIVKDCYIANKDPVFNGSRRKENRMKKTKFR